MTTEAPETTDVSREAHDRVKGENAALQSKVDELTKTVTDLGTKEIVRAHFTSKGLDGDGAEWAATIALPSIPADTVAGNLWFPAARRLRSQSTWGGVVGLLEIIRRHDDVRVRAVDPWRFK